MAQELAAPKEDRGIAMKQYKMLLLLLALAAYPRAQAQTATVSWTTTHQTMDGWGGQDWIGDDTNYILTPAQADMFFSPTTGIGLEYLRTKNSACPETGSCSVSISTVLDLLTLQEAVARGAKIELNIDPPANLKYINSFSNGAPGANGTCIPNSNWPALAAFTVEWIQMMDSNGALVSVLSPFNEPDNHGTYSGGHCAWSAAGIDSYVGGTLGPAMAAAGLGSVQIMIAESQGWSNFGGTVNTCLNDPTCAQYVSIAAAHGYGNVGLPDGFSPQSGYCCAAVTAPPSSASGKKIWQSEVNGGFAFNATAGLWDWDASISDAMVWARNIHDYLTLGNISGYQYWELADCCSGETGAPFNDGLTDSQFNPSKRMCIVGQWSKYARSGWIRIDATTNPASGVYVTAFRDPSSGSFAIVAVNENSFAVSVSFSLFGFPSVDSVTPTVTSEGANLADQADVMVSGEAFSYTLPATSVVTLHSSSSSASSQKNPAPPTALVLKIQ
jgi:glucuronoarabinoxylan endo-1,4-beta-xylanase